MQDGVGDHLGDQQAGELGLAGVHAPGPEGLGGQPSRLGDHDRLGRERALGRGEFGRGGLDHQDGHVVVDVPGHRVLGRRGHRVGVPAGRGRAHRVLQHLHRLGRFQTDDRLELRPPRTVG